MIEREREVAMGMERGLDFEDLYQNGYEKGRLYSYKEHGVYLVLIEGGMCQFRFRRDNQVTICILLSLRKGAGREMLDLLVGMKRHGATRLLARCPASLASNEWYEKNGFVLDHTKTSKTGRLLNCWIRNL